MSDYLIIGNGVAGRTAAETLRKKDGDSSIVMVTDERCPFYPRPKVSLRYLSGEVEKDGMFANPDFYSREAVSLVFGKVIRVEPGENHVILKDGTVIPYRALLIAAGASANMPPWRGVDLDGVVTLRTLEDADNILRRMTDVENIVVVGGGILGVEVSEALRKRGKEVTLLVRGGSDKLGSPVLDSEHAVGRYDRMVEQGVNIILRDEVSHFTGDGSLEKVVTKSGRSIETGLAIVTTGARPNIGFLEGSGIETGRGVIVDAELRTGFPNIFAAGDVAEVVGNGKEEQQYGGPYVDAMRQGEYAAERMFEMRAEN